MQEICQSGSEGGAKPTLSLPLFQPPGVLTPGLEFGHFSSRWRRFFPAAALSTRSKGWLEMAGWQSIGGIAY